VAPGKLYAAGPLAFSSRVSHSRAWYSAWLRARSFSIWLRRASTSGEGPSLPHSSSKAKPCMDAKMPKAAPCLQ
jgi:hypothetical protein